MVGVVRVFEPIKITGLDPHASGPAGVGALQNIVLRLSTHPEVVWSTTFNMMWVNHFYMGKRSASAFGDHITVTCVEEELADGLLDELKTVVAQTNTAYKERIDEAAARDAAAKAALDAKTQRLNQLAKRLKFD